MTNFPYRRPTKPIVPGYKGDPKNYPKIVGPMAQDVEKKFPGAVEEINGHKVINLGFGDYEWLP